MVDDFWRRIKTEDGKTRSKKKKKKEKSKKRRNKKIKSKARWRKNWAVRRPAEKVIEAPIGK